MILLVYDSMLSNVNTMSCPMLILTKGIDRCFIFMNQERNGRSKEKRKFIKRIREKEVRSNKDRRSKHKHRETEER